MAKFIDFGFSNELMEGLEAMQFRDPTPVQEMGIPAILEGRDILACAQTGTGKTAAFLLPLLERAFQTQTNKIDTLIIVPTRELGLQIDQQLSGFGYFVPVSSITVYGGGDGKEFEMQKKALRDGVNVVIATPGKLLSHLNMGYVDMSSLRHLVLDEVDRMLDMGFIEDIMRIISFLPSKRQTLFFSATMPPRIKQFAVKLLENPFEISISVSKPAEGIEQGAYLIHDENKLMLLKYLFDGRTITSAILFAGTRQKVKEVEKELRRNGLNARAIHSDLDQAQREEVLLDFRNKKTAILVATDVVSRGIDVKGIEMVVNYDVPGDPEDYVHRIGRTARAETKGRAVTLINANDIGRFKAIEQLMEREVEKLELPGDIPNGPTYVFNKSAAGRRKPSGKPKKGKPAAKPEITSKRPIKMIGKNPSTNQG